MSLPRKGRRRDPMGVYVKRLPDVMGLKVWLVNGQRIRDSLFIDFTMGGHDIVYPTLVPKGEVWLDANMNVKDREATLLHELTERALMLEKGLTYERAHDKASARETVFRRQGI